MKYLYSALILLGGIIVFFGGTFLVVFGIEKIRYLEHGYECNHRKYYEFKVLVKEKIVPNVLFGFIIVLFLAAFTGLYIAILKLF